jgi:type IV secretion system protein VirB6/type IV secretion system protein TrbL
MKTCFVIVLTCVLLLLAPAPPAWAQTAGDSGVGNITSQFSNSAKKWETSIKGHATKLFWILAAIAAAWTFAVLVLQQADFAALFGAVTRFTFVTFFFFWILDNGGALAGQIMQSTQQIGNDATGMQGVDYGAFVNAGQDILLQVNSKVNVLDPLTGLCADLLALLIFVALCLISLNIILVTAQTWIIAYSGLIFLGFGAVEWTRDMSVGYYKTMLAYGVKLMVTLLLAGIGLDILHNIQTHGGQGWGADLALLCQALAGAAILLGIIAKAPDGVASIAGVSTGGFGHGVGTFLAASNMGYQAGAWAGGAAVQGGKQLGQAVRNAVKQGQALSRGKS